MVSIPLRGERLPPGLHVPGENAGDLSRGARMILPPDCSVPRAESTGSPCDLFEVSAAPAPRAPAAAAAPAPVPCRSDVIVVDDEDGEADGRSGAGGAEPDRMGRETGGSRRGNVVYGGVLQVRSSYAGRAGGPAWMLR